jgi:hypothetical protein
MRIGEIVRLVGGGHEIPVFVVESDVGALTADVAADDEGFAHGIT